MTTIPTALQVTQVFHISFRWSVDNDDIKVTHTGSRYDFWGDYLRVDVEFFACHS